MNAVSLARQPQGALLTRRGRERTGGAALLATALVAPFLAVFGYMIMVSFQRPLDITSGGVLPSSAPTLDNYREVLGTTGFFGYIANSLIIAVLSTGAALLLGLPAAFALAQWTMRRTSLIFLVTRLIPGVALIVPWFVIFTLMGLVDSYLGLALTHLFVTLPFVVWTMIPFFADVPTELWESAKMDGSTPFAYFRRIAVPLVRGGIAASTVLAFVFSWNQFMFAVALAGRKTETVPVAVFNFMSYGSTNWGPITAAAVVITLPVLIIAMLVQRHIVRGLTMGAVKG